MKKLLVVLGVLLGLLLVAYFVVTSSGFLKAVVLPRVGAALNARVEAESISLSPFSSVEIRKLTITPNGAEQLATVEVARVRYSLFAILGGTMAVEEIHVGSPTVSLVQNADGTSNLDPILKKLAADAQAAPAPSGAPGKPVQVDLKSLKIENGSFAFRSTGKDGARMAAGVTALGVSLRNVKNGGSGRLEIASGWKFDQQGGAAGATNNGVQGTLQGGFDLGLSPELAPGAVSGKLDTRIEQATGAFRDFQGFGAGLGAELVPGDLKRLGLDFSRQGTPLGSVTARGPLDLAKSEANLQVDVRAIDRVVLNLAGAAMGLDFTTTRFDSTNHIEVTAAGKKIAVAGAVTGTRVSVKQGELVTPPLDLRKSYDLAVDLAGQSLTIRALGLGATQGGRDVLRGTLSNPMQVSWAPNAPALPDAAFDLTLSDLRLADWSALAGTPLAGSFGAKARLGVQGGGKDLGFDVAATLAGFSGTFASNVVRNLGASATAKGTVAAFADPAKRRLTLAAEVRDLGGDAAVVRFSHYGLEARVDLGLPEGAIVFNDVQMTLHEGTKPGGSVGLKGRWNTTTAAGDLQLTAKDVNEEGLRPFLQAALGDKQLRRVQLAADLGLKLDPAADSAVKATASVTNLVVHDPSGMVPESPLAAGITLDASGSKQKLAVRQAELRLTPTARAKNVASLTGDLDFSKADALKGGFQLTSESMDVTPYFDLFAGGGGSAPAASPATNTPPASTGPMTEPEAIKLPVERLTFEAKVGKFFLREVAAENFDLAVKIEGSRIEVQPLRLALNGAPIQGGMKLDLGVPGYQYDLKVSADRVPVAPFANSFVPMLKDRIGGSFVAGLDVKGAGITGTNLQKHLAGAMNLSVTNANLSLNPKGNQKPGFLTMLVTLLANALNIRELKDQPIMDLVATAKMGGGKIDLTEARVRSASLEAGSVGSIPIAADLMQSPLNFPVNLALNRELAQKARLVPADAPTNTAYVALPAIASMKGTLGAPTPEIDKIATGLLAARGIAGLVGGKTGGTIGAVTDLVGGVSRGESNAVGNLIQGLGGLFGGGKSPAAATPGATPAASPAAATNAVSRTTTNAPAPPATNAAAPRATTAAKIVSTNAPVVRATNAAPAASTNTAPVSSTNATPASATNAVPAKGAAPATNNPSSQVGNALRGLLEKKKKE